MSSTATQDSVAHLDEMIRDFHIGMLVTTGSDGEIHSRPLTVAQVRDDDTLYFAISSASTVAEEVAADPRVNVTMQSTTQFVSLSAEAEISQDRALIERLWSDAWKVWFPGGRNDPHIAILIARPYQAEYWDQSGVRGVRYLFSAAAALARGTTPEPEAGDHGRVGM